MNTFNRIAKAFAVAGLVAGVATSASAKELSLAHFVSPKHQNHTEVFVPLAEKVKDATNGDLTIQIYPAGKLGAGPVKQYSRAIDGVADITFGLPGYTSALFPKTLLVELPGVPHSAKTATAALWDAMSHIEDEFRRVKMLGLWTTAPGILMTRDKPVRSPEDLQGMKIRVPSANVGKSVEAWGGIPVSMPAPAIYNALQTGVVDGVLIDGSTLQSFKLHEVTNYFTTGMPATTSALFLLMNRNSWADLSDEHKKVLSKYTGREMSMHASQAYLDRHYAGLEMVRDMEGKEVIELAPKQAKRFAKLSADITEEVAADFAERGVDVKPILKALGRKNPSEPATNLW